MDERSRETVRLKNRTAASFGFEWSRFDNVYAQYEDNFLGYIHPLGKEFFKGKEVLDAGCGAGRHSYYAAKYGANVTAFDLSADAVRVAIKNTTGLSNVGITQADIYNLPEYWEGEFDCVLCLGVLHHLPDPQEGFYRLTKMLKPGGVMVIWVYGRGDDRIDRLVYRPLRGVTTRMPYRITYFLAFAVAVMVGAANKLGIPLFLHYTDFPFKTKWNDAFDILSAPQSRHYTIADIKEWFEQAGLKDMEVDFRVLCGKKKGIKGLGVK